MLRGSQWWGSSSGGFHQGLLIRGDERCGECIGPTREKRVQICVSAAEDTTTRGE